MANSDRSLDAGIRPAPLRPGDRVAVVAPAGRAETVHLEAGLAVLRSWGLDPVLGESVTGLESGFLAAPDSPRLADLLDAFADPAVRAVITVRGGYGATRIANEFAHRIARTDPIWLVGFSDITALHRALWRARRWQSAHGASVESLGRYGPDSVAATSLHALLFDEPTTITVPGAVVVDGTASGVLHGGNLSLLAALAGTELGAFDPDAILFVEDVNEKPYRVDRLLTQLIDQPEAATIRGVVAGKFVGCDETRAEWPSFTIDEVLAERLGQLDVPVVGDLPSGHVGAANVALPLGARVTIANRALTIEP